MMEFAGDGLAVIAISGASETAAHRRRTHGLSWRRTRLSNFTVVQYG
jgi:hypothetical protein